MGGYISPERSRQLDDDDGRYREERQRAAVLSYPPRWMTIGITSACNNRCTFCSYHSEDAAGHSKVYGVPFTMRLDDFERTVELAWRGRVPRIHICATGEPFLNKRVIDMLDCAADTYGKVSIQSNFYRQIFDKHDYLQQLAKRQDRLSYITTDFLSGDPEQHNRLKTGSSYHDVMHALQYLSNASDIVLDLHFLLTKFNYATLPALVNDLVENGLRNARLNVVNLYSYDFNEFTSTAAVYVSQDTQITRVLERAREIAGEHGLQIQIPSPADEWDGGCDVFWHKVQIWPVQGNQRDRRHENLIPHACRAVVIGELASLGYIFDYDDIMDFWNSPQLVDIRRNLIEGVYPDAECRHCYCYANDDGELRTGLAGQRG